MKRKELGSFPIHKKEQPKETITNSFSNENSSFKTNNNYLVLPPCNTNEDNSNYYYNNNNEKIYNSLVSTIITPHNLTKETLLNFSSNSFKEYTTNLKKQRLLTSDEETFLKKQKALIGGRESAKRVRLRKKEYVKKLETQILKNKKYIEELETQVTNISNKNTKLNNEVIYLMRYIIKPFNQITAQKEKIKKID